MKFVRAVRVAQRVAFLTLTQSRVTNLLSQQLDRCRNFISFRLLWSHRKRQRRLASKIFFCWKNEVKLSKSIKINHMCFAGIVEALRERLRNSMHESQATNERNLEDFRNSKLRYFWSNRTLRYSRKYFLAWRLYQQIASSQKSFRCHRFESILHTLHKNNLMDGFTKWKEVSMILHAENVAKVLVSSLQNDRLGTK